MNMKKRIGILFGTAAVLSLWGAEFDRGGVSFPMEKISAERFGARPEAQKNLLKNSDLAMPLTRRAADGWSKSIWIFYQKNRDKFDKKADKFASAEIVDTPEGKALELNRSVELDRLMGSDSSAFSISFNQTIKLPDENGGNYRFSFDCRNQVFGMNPYNQLEVYNFYDGSDQRPGRGCRLGKSSQRQE